MRTIPGVSLSPVEHFLRPVPEHDDLFAFTIGGKALTDESVTVAENGDLIIEGYAAVWEGEDREGENFVPGAFERASKAFLEAGGPLCFHHKRDHVLGQVTDLGEDDKGLKMRARVDGAIQKHPVLGTLYEQVKKGTLKGLSVGGFFKRAMIEGKRRIADMDFTEISITGVPIHTGPSFAVVAGKALVDDLTAEHVTIPDFPEDEIREDDFMWAQDALNSLDRIFSKLEKRGNGSNSNSNQDAVGVL